MNKSFSKLMSHTLLNLPTPSNISYMWNFGSLLGLFLGVQIMSGFFLSMHYCPSTSMAFNSIIHIMQNVNSGWLFHNIHINGATMFFLCMYIHIARGIYFYSFNLIKTWMIGVTIFLVSMTTAFLGYVLPWGQMSFWGATVITNLLSTIPYLGNDIVMWVWGGFSINNSTLNRFYSIHFILPFLILMLMITHLMFLHESGSSNPLGVKSDLNKIPFHIYFTIKDLYMFMLIILMFSTVILQYPYMFSDPDNFTSANPMVTPVHIQPEWYFLFAYAILRSIPNKLGGVVALMLSIMILYTLPLNSFNFNSTNFYPLSQILFWILANSFIMLTWVGSQSIEEPFVLISQITAVIYFSLLMLMTPINKMWDKLMN
nr:TPA_asm: cytochrome b [Pseudomyrmex flavicornis]